MTSRRVALLVGVSQYGAGFEPLPGSLRDVEEMARLLVHPEIGGFNEVTPLKDPNRQDLETQLETFFKQSAKDDLVLLYFSGHGAKDESGNLFYLGTSIMGKDNRGHLVESSAIAASTIHRFINRCRSRRLVIILDCCFSAAFDPEWLQKGDSTMDIASEFGAEGRVVLASSGPLESSFQPKGEATAEPQLSLYTRYLVEGLQNGAADADADGWVSADELHEYARDKVRTVAPKMNPQLVMVKQQGFKLRLAKAPQGDPKQAYRKEVGRWIRDGNLSPIALRALRAIQVQLGISPTEAAAINDELLQPYREYQEKLNEYRKAFLESLTVEPILSETTCLELEDLQRVLSLRDEDVKEIEAQVVPSFPQTPAPSLSPLLSPSPPTIPPSHQNFTESLGSGITLEMIAIPGGTLLMGAAENELKASSNEYPQHQVTIAPFHMSKFSITQAQYQAVMGSNRAYFKQGKEASQRPVEYVSWHNAVQFCDRLTELSRQSDTNHTYRLPSEAEWEYACRAGTTTPFYFGETLSTNQANYDGNYTYGSGKKGKYRGKTTPVGSFPPNAFGLFDLHGNVWEWCADRWHPNYDDAPIDGSVWETGGDENLRPLRGGSWNDYPRYCRSANRLRIDPNDRYSYVGFRVVCFAARTF